MEKIVLLVKGIYTLRDHTRFGAKYFMDKGYSVEIWRVVRDRGDYLHVDSGLYRKENYYEYTFKQAKKMILRNKIECIFFFTFWDNEDSAELELEIIRNGYRYIYISVGMYGFRIKRPNDCDGGVACIFRRKIKTFLQASWSKKQELIKWKVGKRLLRRWRKRNPPLLVATSTYYNAVDDKIPKELLDEKVLYIHVADYDEYLKEQRKAVNVEEQCIVYCDSGYVDIDLEIVAESGEYVINKYRDEYFSQMECLFEKLEKKYKIPVVILGHPHTKYEKNDYFGREIVFNQTAAYSKRAAVFILNASAAINYAIIYNIPTLFVANRRFKLDPHLYPNVYDFAKYEAEKVLGCGFLDLDDADAMRHPWDYVKKMDEAMREKYIEKYIVGSKSTGKLFFEYVEEAMDSVSARGAVIDAIEQEH